MPAELSSLKFNPQWKRRSPSGEPILPKPKAHKICQIQLQRQPYGDFEAVDLRRMDVPEPEQGPLKWLERLLELSPRERTAHVVAYIVEGMADSIMDQRRSGGHGVRWEALGMSASQSDVAPRKAVYSLRDAMEKGETSVEEVAKRMDVETSVAMLSSIAKSAKSYAFGLRCWAAFCDVMRIESHFPAKQGDVLRFRSIFRNTATFSQYIKHLRFAHRLLRMKNDWYDEVVRQSERGGAKMHAPPSQKKALMAAMVRQIVKQAMRRNDKEMATLYVVARLFLLRVPSEALPLEYDGSHSRLELIGNAAIITLYSRKNSRVPSVLKRTCVCTNEGRALCAVCALKDYAAGSRRTGRLFDVSYNSFLRYLRKDILNAGIDDSHSYGTRAFRRGMARDIIAAGGSLATLLMAGQWSSSAYRAYLQTSSIDEDAIANLVIDASDEE